PACLLLRIRSVLLPVPVSRVCLPLLVLGSVDLDWRRMGLARRRTFWRIPPFPVDGFSLSSKRRRPSGRRFFWGAMICTYSSHPAGPPEWFRSAPAVARQKQKVLRRRLQQDMGSRGQRRHLLAVALGEQKI